MDRRRPGHLPSGGYDGHEFGGGFNRYPPNQTTQLPSGGHGGHEFNGNFDQGYSTRPINPSFQSHPSFNGGGQSNAQANANAESNSEGVGNSKSTSNAQASSQNFANGNIISNAISNTQTNGPNGEASASAAAAAAGVTYVNGIPVATASAAASVASTAPGAGAISSSSSSGPQQIGPNFNSGFNSYREPYYGRAPYPGLNNRPNNGPNNIYDKPVGQQSWFYRSAWDKNDDEIEAHSIKVDQSETDRISKSPDIENVTVVKIPESKSGIVIFKD
ncbi:probable inactive serine/threonine-protein kinase scy2 isoform X2 [Phymastichus coffea]|uniref:probable inactive serine/threonine-protein kinase scy2 isoform X2 n=1 Tax=Phymastichus coffea TaxID=108790 RepID=UPI00273BC2EA|nr:probable inactive serine/threonine-protein kinase scy2 isoform X2 [Phymastichus coffea]